VLAAIALLVFIPLPGALYDIVARVPQAPRGIMRYHGPNTYLWEGIVPTAAGLIAIILLFTPGRGGPRGRRWFRYLRPVVYLAVAVAVIHQATWVYRVRVPGAFTDWYSTTSNASRILQCLVLIVTPAILLVLADLLRRADARRLAWVMVAVAILVAITEAERVSRIPRYPRTAYADWPSDNTFLRIDYLAPWWKDMVEYVLNIDRNSALFNGLPTDWLSMQGFYFVSHGPTETLKWLAALAAGITLLRAHWRLPASSE
jgi:hypothetical protein